MTRSSSTPQLYSQPSTSTDVLGDEDTLSPPPAPTPQSTPQPKGKQRKAPETSALEEDIKKSMAGAKAAIEAAVAKRDEDFNFGTVVADRLRKLPDGYIK